MNRVHFYHPGCEGAEVTAHHHFYDPFLRLGNDIFRFIHLLPVFLLAEYSILYNALTDRLMRRPIMMTRPLLLFLFLGMCAGYSVVARKLTVMAALTGVALALCIDAGAGFTGIGMMAFSFRAVASARSWHVTWKPHQRRAGK